MHHWCKTDYFISISALILDVSFVFLVYMKGCVETTGFLVILSCVSIAKIQGKILTAAAISSDLIV